MKKNPQHRELEVKIDAQRVNVEAFRRWAFDRLPSKYQHVVGPDTYYIQGKNVLRHRERLQSKPGAGAGELTVKRRTSKKSTTDRLEIDLPIGAGATIEDVRRFLAATGWKPEFTVVKDCHIFWYEDRNPGVEVVLYEVRCIYPNGRETQIRSFLEIEIHKADSDHPKALTTLKDWEDAARKAFELGETQKESLYEIYSGRRYGLIKK